MSSLVWISAVFIGSLTSIDLDSTTPKSLPPSGKQIHLGGESVVTANQDESGTWRCGDARIDTPLPAGYPAPTAPGIIELKSYPLVRRAKVEGKIAPDLASNFGFWKLFNHIKSREIAMTSPVEMEYDIDIGAPSPKVAGWAMSFLYRTPDLGPTGIAGAVVVEDEAELTVISIGFQGGYGVSQLTQRIDQLNEELKKLPHLELAGKPRALFYNGPEVRSAKRWGEAQIPVKLRTKSKPETAEKSGENSGT
ncbi:MAG: hypothetical protein CBC13_11785 [Planctomycetia bacterium TMED53]|nr:MAG: hypothetical protein CBC13_11785 [Planctomycetia bacterium TMED53]